MAKLTLTNLQVKEKNGYNKDNFIIIKSLERKYSVNNITSKYIQQKL